ncbi:MAG: ROK family protein [Saprospiraceae bacterium]
MQSEILGIDVGATGMKGALVDIEKGVLVSERFRLATPDPATPKAMGKTFQEIIKHFDYSGPIGCGFPAVIKSNTAMTAANIDKSWVGKNVASVFGGEKIENIHVLNDADAAAIAEMTYGKGKGKSGLIIMITIGTGIGSCLFLDGKMLANTELGHVVMHGKSAEKYCANSVRKALDLSWDEWGKRFNEYLQYIYHLLSPDSIILSGGVSKKFGNYKKYIDIPIEVTPAALLNNAGIVGAAAYGAQQQAIK